MNSAPPQRCGDTATAVTRPFVAVVDRSLTQLVQPQLTTKPGCLSGHTCSLVEEHRLDLRILHVDALTQFEAKLHAALDGRAAFNGFKPTFQIRKLLDVLSLPLPEIGPAETCHIGDRIFSG